MRFEDKIRLLAVLYRFSVTSWFRSVDHNKAVGGVERSKHLLGLAADCVLDHPGQKEDFMETVRWLKLKALDEGDHVHIEEI